MQMKLMSMSCSIKLSKGVLGLLCLICTYGYSMPLPVPGKPKGRIVALNQDPTEMPYSLAKGEETVEGVRKYFFSVSKGGLTHFFINPNAHNTSYASKVWDPVWCDDPRLKSSAHMKQFENARILHENGVDWVKVMVDACREQGVSPWISMRMNDLHNIGDLYQFSNSRFWLDHPELRRRPGKVPTSSWDSEVAFDYAHKAVRDHSLALVREMLEKWDVDGFEFDWLRFPHHVTPEAEVSRTGCTAITEFMREAKKIIDEVGHGRGKRLLISARVAAMPEAAVGLGTDAVAWAGEGLVDWVAPCNFFGTTDFEIPYVEWKQSLNAANPNVRLVGALDFAGVARENHWNPQGLTTAEFCGYLERMYAAGIFDFECFNKFAYHESPINRFVQIDGMAEGEKWVRARDRAYVVTYHDARPEGYPSNKRLPAGFDRSFELTINIGRVGCSSSAALMLAFAGPIPSSFENGVRLNGVPPCARIDMKPSTWMPSVVKVSSSCRLEFPLSAVRDGDNCVTFDAIRGETSRMHTCELLLRAETQQ